MNVATPSPQPQPQPTGFELRFMSLFAEGRGLAFPCDRAGQVELAALSDRALRNYLYARHVIGREFRCPAVQAVATATH